MAPLLVGLALGVAIALAASRVLEGVLYEVRPADPVVFALVVVVLATLAAGVPALRAARIDPLTALRHE